MFSSYEIKEIAKELSQFKNIFGESPSVFFRDGMIYVSGEDGKSFVEYYGTGDHNPYPYIDEQLENYARSKSMHWEWENPGCIVLIR